MRKLYLYLVLPLFLTACGVQTPAPTATQASTFTPIPSLTPTATPTEARYTLPQYDPALIIYDFTSNLCTAQWGNGAHWFDGCPGDLTDISAGYFEAQTAPAIEGAGVYQVPSILVLPSQNAIFGKYPPFAVQAGDQFRAVLACQGEAPCDVQFALEYFDQAGRYHPTVSDLPWPLQWDHHFGEGPIPIAVDLSGLAGQTVQFTLAVRDEGNTPLADYALWIQPVILRDPSVTPAAVNPSVGTSATTNSTSTAQTPGVISGVVDMSAAPSFLQDDPVLGSAPVVMVFFNQDNGTYWWIHTTLTGHPNYQMTVPSGRYYVLAYAEGIPGMEIVNAAYTGQSPSCGQPLQIVNVTPNARVTNINITDWQQTCSGTAYRPEIPSSVPLP